MRRPTTTCASGLPCPSRRRVASAASAGRTRCSTSVLELTPGAREPRRSAGRGRPGDQRRDQRDATLRATSSTAIAGIDTTTPVAPARVVPQTGPLGNRASDLLGTIARGIGLQPAQSTASRTPTPVVSSPALSTSATSVGGGSRSDPPPRTSGDVTENPARPVPPRPRFTRRAPSADQLEPFVVGSCCWRWPPVTRLVLGGAGSADQTTRADHRYVA